MTALVAEIECEPAIGGFWLSQGCDNEAIDVASFACVDPNTLSRPAH